MKKVIIISGAQGTGKTVKALEIAKGKKVFEGSDNLRTALTRMPIDTEVIIMEFFFISDILNAIRAEYMEIRRPYLKNTISIKIPDLIITTCQSIEYIEKIQQSEIIKLTSTY